MFLLDCERFVPKVIDFCSQDPRVEFGVQIDIMVCRFQVTDVLFLSNSTFMYKLGSHGTHSIGL